MIERARNHDCDDPDGFSKGIAKIVEEAVGNHLQLGMYECRLYMRNFLKL